MIRHVTRCECGLMFVYRTATRATLALFPLFGVTGILFAAEPKGSVTTVLAYRIVHAVLQTSQVTLVV